MSTPCLAIVLLVVVALPTLLAQLDSGNLDQFNYRRNDFSLNNDYGPKDWDKIRCNDVDTCLGYPDSFKASVGWKIGENFCQHCPINDPDKCGLHHQSPINLERIPPYGNECIDVHWMQYHDSSCGFEELQAANAFVIERHTLKVIQPIELNVNGTYEMACTDGKATRRWGRIDFSRGFTQWWYLSHMDIHVPSEHTQMGKQYDGEIHLYHFYSASAKVAGIHNEMASVTIFLQAYDNVEDFPELNRLICEWREVEDKTREECGLPSIEEEYPGCVYHRRGHSSSSSTGSGTHRNLRREEPLPTRRRPWSAFDVILHNDMNVNNISHVPKRIQMSEADFEPAPQDFDWPDFINSYEADKDHRHLMNYDEVPWFNYFPMLGVQTEYYYRYSGSQTVPPCYGKWFKGNDRRQTNHWRVMKDPMRVSQRQIDELHRLLRMRIAPKDDPLRACKPDTAGKLDRKDPNKISVARPLQSTQKTHYEVFCECQDWDSKFQADKDWCKIDQETRLLKTPYNFDTNGF